MKFFGIEGRAFFFARACAHAFERSTDPLAKSAKFLLALFSLLSFSIFSTTTLRAQVLQNGFPALTATQKKAVDAISNPDEGTSVTAVQTLGLSRNWNAATPLEKAYGQENRASVRRYIVNALGLIHNPSSKTVLLSALNDSDVSVRQSAVVSLQAIGGADVDSALIQKAMSEKSPAVKAFLAQYCGRSHHPKAKDALKKLAQDPDRNVQDLAQRELNRKAKQAASGK